MKRTILLIPTLVALLAAGPSTRGAEALENWNKICTKCHGKDGKGNTKMGKKLGIVDHTDPKVQATYTDEQMFNALKEGIKGKKGEVKMKSYKDQLTNEEIKALVAYVRTLVQKK